MKKALFAAVLLGTAAVGYAQMESLSANAERNFLLTPMSVRSSVQAAAMMSRTPQLKISADMHRPTLRALGADERLGDELGRVSLSSQLDRNLSLVKDTFGSRTLDVGITADAGAKSRFLTFTDASGTSLGAIGSLSDLRGKGVDIRIDAGTVYNFRVEVGSIFDDPVHKSILHITPTQGTQGPSSQMTTGALLDAMRATSTVVPVNGEEYWVWYGRDAKADGSGFASTRSFLLTHEAGMSTKAWPIAESSLPLDTPTVVSLDDLQLQMTRTSAGQLIISSSDSN